jgi:hypothetical protein
LLPQKDDPDADKIRNCTGPDPFINPRWHSQILLDPTFKKRKTSNPNTLFDNRSDEPTQRKLRLTLSLSPKSQAKHPQLFGNPAQQ